MDGREDDEEEEEVLEKKHHNEEIVLSYTDGPLADESHDGGEDK